MRSGSLIQKFNQVIGPILAVGLMIYFAYHLIQGERGLLSWRRMTQKIQTTTEKLEKLQAEHQELELKVRLMRPHSLDPDMLEEQAREKLNFARKDEIIIPNSELESLPLGKP